MAGLSEGAFDTIVSSAHRYFGRRMPQAETLASWWMVLKDLDSRSAPFIHGKILEVDNFPSNFPVAVKKIYWQWKRENSQIFSAEREEVAGCQECENGLLPVVKEIAGVPYTFVFRCGDCKTHPDEGIPFASMSKLEFNGYRLDWQVYYAGVVDKDLVRNYVKGAHKVGQDLIGEGGEVLN
jgi:hypothetical protein